MNALKNNWMWILTAVVVVAIGGWLIWSPGGSNTAQAQTGDTAVAFMGDLAASASAGGQLQAQQTAQLAFAAGGTVSEVMVEEGDVVAADDTLVQLETAALQRAVLDAQQALIVQENNLARLTATPSAAQLAAAQANVNAAQARLDSLEEGPTEAELAAAAANVRAAQADVSAAQNRLNAAQSGGAEDQVLAAQAALADAQEAYTRAEEAHRAEYDCRWNNETEQYDCEAGTKDEEAARVPAQQAYAELVAAQERLNDLQAGGDQDAIAIAQAGLASAAAQRDAAQARYDLLQRGATEAEIAAAEATLAQAQSQLAALLDDPSESQLAQQETAVEQARIALVRAEKNLADATLTAPFGGVVTAVNVSVGETASGPVVELLDLSSMEVVLSVDEVDIGTLEVGQPAVVTMETWPTTEIAAEVAAIAPENTPNSSGTVAYDVHLALSDDHDLPLRAGMTADAQLVTATRTDVLLVPNAAVRSNRAAGTYFVDVVEGINEDGIRQLREVEVEVGLRDGEYTQITGGLDAGTEVAVGYRAAPVIDFGGDN